VIVGVYDKYKDSADFQITTSSPIVYLDQCALQHFSANQADRELFLNILKTKNGTVYFSALNLMEIIVLDKEGPRYVRFKNFIDGIGNRFALIDTIPQLVIALESGKNSLSLPENVKADLPPPLDDKLLLELLRNRKVKKKSIWDWFVRLVRRRSKAIKVENISFADLMRASESDNDRVREIHEKAKERIKQGFDEALKKAKPRLRFRYTKRVLQQSRFLRMS